MKYHKQVTELLARCEDSSSWDIEKNEELRLLWREEVEGNFIQIYKDLLQMETALATARHQFQSLENTAEAAAERLRQALQ